MKDKLQSEFKSAGISSVIFGTMRLLEKGQTPNQLNRLFDEMYEAGINTHHISHEYESYRFYQDCYRNLISTGKKVKLISKHSSPHFGEDGFSPQKFTQDIEDQLRFFNTDQVDAVQWMYRLNPLDDEVRIAKTTESAEVMKDTFTRLQQEGKVGAFGHFPYSVRYAEKVKALGILSPLITYLNMFEQDYEQFAMKEDFLAIRPLAAGKVPALLKNDTFLDNVAQQYQTDRETVVAAVKMFPFLYQGCKGAIVSISNSGQLMDLLESFTRVKALDNKYAMLQALKSQLQLITTA